MNDPQTDPASMRRHDVFISHASVNRDLAEVFAYEMTQVGMRPFLAPFSINVGREWKPQILAALSQCPLFLLLATPESIASTACMHEVGAALLKNQTEGGRLIVPIVHRVDFSSLPAWITDHHGMQFNQPDDAESIKQGLKNLAAWIREADEMRLEDERRKRWAAFFRGLALSSTVAFIGYQVGKHARRRRR